MKIKNFTDLIKELEPLKKNNDLIFRGQSNVDWEIIPKSGRNGFSEKYTKTLPERQIFNSWKRYAKSHLSKHPETEWDWLAIAQHHGLATRLLDWSKNPLVAAFFACIENNDSDGVIYYYKLTDVLEFDERTTSPFDFKGFNIFFPSGLVSRIINQRGLFTITDKPTVGLEKQLKGELKKIIISKEAKENIIMSLDFYGINKLSLYNDIDSLSEYLNDYVANNHSNNLNQLITEE
ncbi:MULTISPECIES: FRG domain-containing protein [Winogradskyella]|uniref:FRG domain-containing protein n=1 Tax=Winogradskyella damuponensis TaxID=943939 RepID=A0ABP8CNX5_9FLAO